MNLEIKLNGGTGYYVCTDSWGRDCYVREDLKVYGSYPAYFKTREEAQELLNKFNLKNKEQEMTTQNFAVNTLNADIAAALLSIATTEKGYTNAPNSEYSDTKKFLVLNDKTCTFAAAAGGNKVLTIQEFVDLPKGNTNKLEIAGAKYVVDKVAKVVTFETYSLTFEEAQAFIDVMASKPDFINASHLHSKLAVIEKVRNNHTVRFDANGLRIGCRNFTPDQVKLFAEAIAKS